MPHTVTRVAQVAIAGVFAPGLAEFPQVNFEIFSFGRQEWADDGASGVDGSLASG